MEIVLGQTDRWERRAQPRPRRKSAIKYGLTTRPSPSTRSYRHLLSPRCCCKVRCVPRIAWLIAGSGVLLVLSSVHVAVIATMMWLSLCNILTLSEDYEYVPAPPPTPADMKPARSDLQMRRRHRLHRHLRWNALHRPSHRIWIDQGLPLQLPRL